MQDTKCDTRTYFENSFVSPRMFKLCITENDSFLNVAAKTEELFLIKTGEK